MSASLRFELTHALADSSLHSDGLGVSAIVLQGAEFFTGGTRRNFLIVGESAGGGGGRGGVVPRGCVVHRHWEAVDIERAALRGLRQGRLCLHAELTNIGFAFAERNASCTEDSYSSGYVLGFDLRSRKEVVTEFKDVTANSWIFSNLGKVTHVRHFLILGILFELEDTQFLLCVVDGSGGAWVAGSFKSR